MTRADWSRRHTPLRLRPGLVLFQTGRRGYLLQDDDGELLRLRVPEALVQVAWPVLQGESDPATALATAGAEAEDLADLLGYFDQEGYLDLGAAPVVAEIAVAAIGEGPVLRALAELLPAAGFALRPSPAGADAVVVCAGELPDAVFTRLDEECAAASRAMHTCHLEGRRVFLGPLALPGGDGPRYGDLRARRLAADVFPDARAALWCALADGRSARAAWPPPAAAALAAAHLVHDLVAWRAGGRPAGADHLVLLDPLTLAAERHRLLPVPRGLMLVPPA